MVTALHDKREQDNRRPEPFDWGISAICWHVEQNRMSADGNPRTETLKSPQRDLPRLEVEVKQSRVCLEFQGELLPLFSC